MNKIGMLSALAVATAAGTAMAQPQLEIRTVFNDGTISKNISGPTTDKLFVYVQARVNNWQQGLYQSTSGTGVNNATTIGTGTGARDLIGWSIMGLIIRSTENAVGGVNALPRKLDKGKLTVQQFLGSGNDTRLTTDPTWQAESTTGGNVPHYGWTHLLRAGAGGVGETNPGNGVPRVIAGKLAVVGSTTDNSVSVSDLNLGPDPSWQGTNIGLNGTGTTLAVGDWKTLYVLQYDTTDYGANRSFDITVALATDQSGNKLAGLYNRHPNSGTNQGQFQNETFADPLASNTVHINVVVPAPGAMALMGLGGLFAARRRRTA